ncbi:hypothetical protein KY290_038386 [Solanum tuberosum]|uniref:MULE transposase domain-containing protein n=1 Tax=Solanum tuberosum TaxID=4113 RepID=A0ABQ7U000_SOLTU|nr:hypothetical protein KY290_038386 [Solanum tuberosum]
MIASVIEAGELTCNPNDLVISYQMNGRGKIHLTFIKTDRNVSLYMLDIVINGSRPTLRINVNVRPQIEPTNSFNGNNDSIGNERFGDHSKESLSNNSNESLGDHSINIHDDPTNVENQPVDAEDLEPKCSEEMQGEQELGSQSNHSFSDGTNLCINQTFNNNNKLQLLLAEAAAKKSFDFSTVKSCTKYLKVKYVSHNCAWILRARKYECSDIFVALNMQTVAIEKFQSKSLLHFVPNLKMLEGWCGCQGNGPRDSGEWIFMVTGICPHEKGNCGQWHSFTYEGVLLSDVAQDTENHVYLIAFCVMDKENDASWTFFFEKWKEIVVDEPDLYFIFDRHKSIANGLMNVYNHAHHGYSAMVLEHDIGFEKWSRAHFPGNRYDVMTTNIAESLNVMLIDEREYLVASIFNSIANRFGELFRERHAYILKSMGNQMVPIAEKIARKKMIEGNSLYGENVIGDGNQFTVFGAGVTANIPCAHAMAGLRSKHGNEYGMSIYEYSSPLYKVEAYLPTYMNSINVVPLESEWCVPEEFLNMKIIQPLVNTKLGRKRRKRVKGVSENFKSKRRNKCSICKRIGHKRTTCVNSNKS